MTLQIHLYQSRAGAIAVIKGLPSLVFLTEHGSGPLQLWIQEGQLKIKVGISHLASAFPHEGDSEQTRGLLAKAASEIEMTMTICHTAADASLLARRHVAEGREQLGPSSFEGNDLYDVYAHEYKVAGGGA